MRTKPRPYGMEGEVRMAIQPLVQDGVLVVRLHGELDHHVVESIRQDIEEALQQSHYKGLVLSFRGIDFMDSSGLGLILGRYRSISQRHGKMALCEVNSSLQRIFDMSGLLKIVPLHASEELAVRAVKEA